jgi:hypothetical protein
VTAHRDIKGEHVATSSAEAETYACALFANEVLALSYIAEEAGLWVGPRHRGISSGGNETHFRPAGGLKNIVYENRGVFDKFIIL